MITILIVVFCLIICALTYIKWKDKQEEKGKIESNNNFLQDKFLKELEREKERISR